MNKKKKANTAKRSEIALRDALSLYSQISDLKKQIGEAADSRGQSEVRITDLEVHINLLTRLLTTLCIEKFGIRISALKRLVQRIEKEAVRDSQIIELESLYKLSQESLKKKASPRQGIKEDPWDQIS